jgi:integrase
MGIIFKPYVTRPLPAGARIIEREVDEKLVRFAVWTEAGEKRPGKEKRHEARVTGERAKRVGIRVRSAVWWAQYTDGAGATRRISTGCREKPGALAVLADLERRAELVRSNVVTQAEATVADHAHTPIAEHVAAYVEALACKRGKGARRTVSPEHVANVTTTLRLAVEECGFRWLRDLNREAVERWVRRMTELPDEAVVDNAGCVLTPARPSARTINARLAALTALGNWLVDAGRLVANPFGRLHKLDEADDVRRKRRALTTDELRRLLTVARLRPVAEFGRQTVRVVDEARPKASRATWKREGLTLDTIVEAAERGRERLRGDVLERLERAGRERALLYAVLVTTGLRKGELAALTLDDVHLDDERPVLVLPGADAKNGQRATMPLRADVAGELRAWVDEQAEAVCRKRIGVAGRVTPPASMPLFNVPTGLVRILDRDLAAAGIPKRDDRGRTIDVHAMRHTFASHLVAAGVAPRVAQAAMRHSSLELTMQLYTDPRLLDVAGALDRLPALPGAESMPEAARATGTDDSIPVALPVALNLAARGHIESIPDSFDGGDDERVEPTRNAKTPRTTNDSRRFGDSGRRDSNPRHPAWEASALPTELRPRTFPTLPHLCPAASPAAACEPPAVIRGR